MLVSLPGQSCRSIEGQELSGNLFQRCRCVQARANAWVTAMPPQVSQPEAGQVRKPCGTRVKVWVLGKYNHASACKAQQEPCFKRARRSDARTLGSAGRLDPRTPCRIGTLLCQFDKIHCNKRVFRLFTSMVPTAGDIWRFLRGKDMRFKLYMGYTEASSLDEENQEPGIFLRATGWSESQSKLLLEKREEVQVSGTSQGPQS